MLPFAKVLCVLRGAYFAVMTESPVSLLFPFRETKQPLSKRNLAAIAGPVVSLGCFWEGREYL